LFKNQLFSSLFPNPNQFLHPFLK